MRLWKEKLDPTRHKDFRYTDNLPGGRSPWPSRDGLIEAWVYMVNVCSFTFQFHRLEDIQEYLDYFSQKPLPSSGKSGGPALEPDWRAWHERIPMRLKNESKRVKVVKALERALEEFSKP
jgi:hypothetical protein